MFKKFGSFFDDMGGFIFMSAVDEFESPELIHKSIGEWFKRAGLYPWPKGRPPTVRLQPRGERAFDVSLER